MRLENIPLTMDCPECAGGRRRYAMHKCHTCGDKTTINTHVSFDIPDDVLVSLINGEIAKALNRGFDVIKGFE